MNLVREKIVEEKAEREIVKFAQTQAMAEWKKDLDTKRKSEMDRYMSALNQEDMRYDVENNDEAAMEQALIDMYKRA